MKTIKEIYEEYLNVIKYNKNELEANKEELNAIRPKISLLLESVDIALKEIYSNLEIIEKTESNIHKTFKVYLCKLDKNLDNIEIDYDNYNIGISIDYELTEHILDFSGHIDEFIINNEYSVLIEEFHDKVKTLANKGV